MQPGVVRMRQRKPWHEDEVCSCHSGPNRVPQGVVVGVSLVITAPERKPARRRAEVRSRRDVLVPTRSRGRALGVEPGAAIPATRRCPRLRIHGEDGRLASVSLESGERLPFSFVFLFLGALPCTEWLDDTVARDDDGFVLTGAAASMDNLLETDIPGVFAAGDVRSGSTKRCATAVGEGAMAVQFVHAYLARSATARGAQAP